MAGVTESILTENRQTLSDELIKESAVVEAQNDFRFDRPSRTVIVDVASVFRVSEEAKTALAYDLATNFAPVFWGRQLTDTVRPESLALFSVTVDDLTFRCPSESMLLLADRELSSERFVEQCRQ